MRVVVMGSAVLNEGASSTSAVQKRSTLPWHVGTPLPRRPNHRARHPVAARPARVGQLVVGLRFIVLLRGLLPSARHASAAGKKTLSYNPCFLSPSANAESPNQTCRAAAFRPVAWSELNPRQREHSEHSPRKADRATAGAVYFSAVGGRAQWPRRWRGRGMIGRFPPHRNNLLRRLAWQHSRVRWDHAETGQRTVAGLLLGRIERISKITSFATLDESATS